MLRYWMVLICSVSVLWGKGEVSKEEYLAQFKKWELNRVIAKTYAINNLSFGEVRASIKAMLSKSGGLNYIASRNAVLVMDIPKVQFEVRAFLKAVRRNPVNVSVKVSFKGHADLKYSGLHYRTDGRSGTRVRIKDDKVIRSRSIDVKPVHRTGTVNSNNTVTLTTLSGHSAQLWSVRTEVQMQLFNAHRFYHYNTRTGVYGRAIIFDGDSVSRDIGVSLWMKPIYQDNGLIKVSIYPVLSTKSKGRIKNYRTKLVKTELFVRNGQTINIGGSSGGLNRFFTNFFGGTVFSKSKTSQALDITLTPTAREVKVPKHLIED